MGKASKEALVVLGILTLIGLGLRLAQVHLTYVHQPVRADAREFVLYAKNLTQHGVFSRAESDDPAPDSFRSPGYPFLLAGAMLVSSGGWYYVMLYLQAVLGAAMVPLTFLLGRRFLPAPFALAAAGLTALSPHLVTATDYLLTETLYGFLLLLGIYLFVRRLSIAAGIVFGLAALVNETALLLVPLLGAAWLLGRTGGLRHVLVAVAVFAILPAAWLVRGRLTVPEGGESRAIMALSHGAYPGFVYRSEEKKYYAYEEDPEQPRFSRSLSDFLEILFRRISERPGRYAAWYLLEKPWNQWRFGLLQGHGEIYVYPSRESPYQRNPVVDLTRRIMKWLHPVAVLLALLAVPLLVVLGRRGRIGAEEALPLRLCLFSLAYYTLLGMVFVPWPRYVVPLKPELFLAAAFSAATIAARISSGRAAGS